MVHLTSAGGIIALLSEDDPELKVFALQRLNAVVDDFWAEISNSIDKIEILYEDASFPHRCLAALIASKVYYHLGELEDSLSYALGADKQFDVNVKTLYTTTILAKAIDKYTEVRVAQHDRKEDVAMDARLDVIVNRMFEHCFDRKSYKQAAGIALETRRTDILRRAIVESPKPKEMLPYVFEVVMTLVANRAYRNEVLGLMAALYQELDVTDHLAVCQCLIVLDDSKGVASILNKLFQNGETGVAYQIAFDLYERAPQQFLTAVRQQLVALAAEPGATLTDVIVQKLKEILVGDVTLPLQVEFLSRNNNADIVILTNTKDTFQRNSVLHSATVMSNALMYAGTTSDAFLRSDAEWLKQSNNWAKFSTVASLGVIHKGHVSQAMNVLSPYLPKEGVSNSPYERGGSLYALGLISANHGSGTTDFLSSQLRATTQETIQHGGALGLGLAGMATGNMDLYGQLRDLLQFDNAIAGEAAAIGMGLIMAGSGNMECVDHLRSYGQETQHEKIIRGTAVGVAMIMYGRQEEADGIIEALLRDQDPIMRMSACHTIAMAYAGTNENRLIKRLLHEAVSDVSDDVRRSAVIALGFLIFRNPEHMPSVVSLLCESFNPHVRYGSCIALGIACAGTGSKDAIALIEPMTQDSVGFVRQGAFIAFALIMIQQPNSHSKSESFRKLLAKVVADKHEDILARFGAIFAQGILEAGGRNVTIQLARDHGHMDMQTVIGLLMFTQFWFWFPLGYFLSLALKPTAVICVNSELKMPKLELISNCPPSTFAYPPATEVPKEKTREKVETAILSTSSKAKGAKAAKKAETGKDSKEGGAAAMEVDSAEKKAADEKAESEKPKEKEKEPEFSTLQNPARVVLDQLSKITFPKDSRYTPVREAIYGGITIVKDSTPDQPEDLLPLSNPKDKTAGADEEKEPAPPADFEFKPELDD